MTQLKARSLRIAMEIVAALILGFFFVAGVVVYFLSTGPVSIQALTPMIERALNSDQSPYEVTIEDTQVVWAGWDRAVDVVARNVTLHQESAPPIAVIPEVSVGVSFRALMAGDVKLNTLEILNPVLTLQRNPDGTLALSFGDSTQEEEHATNVLDMPDEGDLGVIPKPVLDALTARVDEPGPLGTLSQFSIINAELQIIDRALGESLWLRGIGLDVRRDLRGLDASLVGTLESTTGNALIGATLQVIPDLDRIDTSLAFDRLDTVLPIRYLPELVFYLPDLTIGGQVGASFDLNGAPRHLSAKLDSAAGTIELSTEIFGELPASQTDVTLTAFDSAVWLGGLYDLGDALDYAPRVPVSGTARITVDETGKPVDAQASLTSEVGNLTARLSRDDVSGSYQVSTSASDIQPNLVAATAPSLGPLETITTPLELNAGLVFTEAWALNGAAVEFGLGRGILDLPEIGTLPEIEGAQGRIRLTQLDGPILLDALTLSFGEPVVRASGTLNPVEAGHTITLNAMVSDLEMGQLSAFWPADLAPNPREWTIENIPSGHVPQANIALSLLIPAEEGLAGATVEHMNGAIDLHNAEVHYLRPLTPAVDVSGFAEFTADRFDIDVQGGTVDDATIREGRIELTELGQAVEKIDIDLDIDTPLPTALALLDTEPRRYISKIGLEAGAIDGFARAKVGFAFPLLLDLTGDQIHYEAEAEIQDVQMPNPDLDAVISADVISLSLSPGQMEVSGDVRVGDIPAAAVWQETFDETSDQKRYMSLTSVLDVAELAAFGLDLSDYATGRAGLALNLADFRSGVQSLALTANLSESNLFFDPFNWQKDPGVPAELVLQAITRPDGTTRIENFMLSDDADTSIQGAAELEQGFGALLAARIDRFRMGRTDVSGTVTRVGESFALKLVGPELDAEPFIDDEDQDDQTIEVEEEEGGPNLQISGTFEHLHLGPERAIRSTELSLSIEEGDVRSLTMHGLLREDRKIDVNYIPTPSGGRELFVLAEDTGLALAVADLTGELEGGTLQIQGSRETPDSPLVGQLEVTDFKLREAPSLARILEVISVTGILSALSNEGLAFNSLTADFSMTEDAITITDGAARGDSLGITVEGTVDRTRDELDLSGEVAVSDLFSKTIGQLPIIELIVGEGLIGAAYTMSGPIDDPSIGVNPLSVIAPGFLRKVFQGDVEGATTPDPTLNENDRGN